jgi:hypothetical protein
MNILDLFIIVVNVYLLCVFFYILKLCSILFDLTLCYGMKIGYLISSRVH